MFQHRFHAFFFARKKNFLMDHFSKFPIVNGPGRATAPFKVLLVNEPWKLLLFTFKSEVSIVL